MRKFAANQVVSAVAGLAMAGFVWAAPASANVNVQIDVSSQTMTVSVNGRYYATWKVSTAGKGYYTPRGSFRSKRLARMHYSRKYDNSPMPHSISFTRLAYFITSRTRKGRSRRWSEPCALAAGCASTCIGSAMAGPGDCCGW